MDPNKMRSAKDSWKSISLLAYQSLGVVYGDLSISPLYVFKSTFTEDVGHSKTNEEIYGVLSFLFWSLTLIPLFKYVFIVLRADDNGGTFGLYSLICRHANISLLPSRQFADEELSTYKLRCPPKMKNTSSIKIWLEKHKNLHTALLVVVMIGTCMVIGDGIVTPALSVFSAVSGLEVSESKVVRHEYTVVTITCFLLVCLFALQNHGTHRVGHLFAPIILVWLLCISAIGIYNIIHWNHHVYKAVSPYYMLKFLKKTKTSVWNTLGGILLCITGSEAMFADLGHFSYTAIQVAFTFLVYPALILSYMGQAAYLSKNHDGYISVHIGFYDSVPGVIWIPVSIIAILASVVGSQAVISGTFSIIKQSESLGCFPRIKVVHTSDKIHGQIYIPEINWMLMVLSIAVVVGFRDTRHMGNASGLAEMTVMLVTTFLTSLVMILCWSKPPLVALAFLLFFGSIEALYFSASLTKFLEGAWFPVLLGLLLVMIMFIWHYTTIKKYEFNLQNKLSLEWLLTLDDNLGVVRVPGIGIVFTDLISGVPASFSHFVTNLPAFHRILVFVCVKSVPVPFVPPAERYLVGRVGPPMHGSYRCIVRYGYRDAQDVDMFESELVSCLADFVRFEATSSGHWSSKSPEGREHGLTVMGSSMFPGNPDNDMEESNPAPCSVSLEVPKEDTAIELAPVGPGGKRVRFLIEGGIDEGGSDKGARQELEELWAASECGTTFIMGNSHVRAKPRSSTMKKVTVNLGYGFLRRNCRGPDVALRVPAASMLEVGIVCVV